LHASDEGVAPVLVLLIQEREVSGKALAEPHVIPISFGGGVPEPLMRHLVGKQLAIGPGGWVSVENVGGELHAAAHAVGFHLSQLLVGIRTDMVDVELEDGLRELAENF